MSEDSGKPKPRPRPLPRTRRPTPRPKDKPPEPAAPAAQVADIHADSQTTYESPRPRRPAPSPPSRSPDSESSPEGSKPKNGSLPRNTSGSSNSSPIVAMRSEAAKLAAMAMEAERRVKAMSTLQNEREEVADSRRDVSVNLPTIDVDRHDTDSKGDVAATDQREPPQRPLRHPPSSQVDTCSQSNERQAQNTRVLTRVSQKPARLVIGHSSQSHGLTLGVQYPGYTPTSPPDIDSVGGRLVRFTGGFEVWDTYASEEYDRRNRDSNPLFSSAEFELEKRVNSMDSYIVELRKGIDGLICGWVDIADR